MQVTQADSNDLRRVGVKEDHIKFRPSPNFKNMKKFLKNRSNNVAPEPTPVKVVEQQVEVKPVVFQPPLPTYPPPPDSPLDINITIKQEKEDTDAQNTSDESVDGSTVNPESLMVEPEKTDGDRPKKTMCKEFIRGDCKRSVCRFSHELDLTQLRGVYTFCWNYQNARCTYPYCKFVHASIFEEAEFYRTGILPSHARAHLKKPLPPPPEDTQANIPSNFANPPPVLLPGLDKQMPVISCVPPSSIEQRPEEFGSNVPRSTSPLKREWNELEEFSSSPRDLEAKDQLTKKCKNCDILEFRLQYNKEKVENMIQTSEEINKKLNMLDKKHKKLTFVLMTIMKPANNIKATNSITNDKEKVVLEQLNNYITTNNRYSSIANVDSVKNIFGSNANLSNLMAKLLCSTGDPRNLSSQAGGSKFV